MKKLLLLFIATSFVLSQNLISSVDEKYENGNIKAISYHKKRLKKIGLVKKETYYENGQIESEENYRDGAEHGKWAKYYENGQLENEKNYRDGEKAGKWTEYHENGQTLQVGNYRDGKKHGKFAAYGENGQIKFQINFKDGAEYGKGVEYHENGKIREEVDYKDGEANGKGRRYYENGQIKEEAKLKNGELDGKYTYYNEDGSIDKVEEYRDGNEIVEHHDYKRSATNPTLEIPVDVVPVAILSNQIQIGIESIIEKNGKVEIDIYALNNHPIAGVQLEINPADIFKIDSIGGGRCGDIDFTLRSNPKGLMLGFSMSGNMIPVSRNQITADNVLFTAYGEVIKNVKNKMVTLESTLAGKGGAKIDVLSIPYEWNGK